MVISLKLSDWPLADQRAWAEACRPRQGLKRGGAAAPLAPITTTDLERPVNGRRSFRDCGLSKFPSWRVVGYR